MLPILMRIIVYSKHTERVYWNVVRDRNLNLDSPRIFGTHEISQFIQRGCNEENVYFVVICFKTFWIFFMGMEINITT
jgi:hypothetical protein